MKVICYIIFFNILLLNCLQGFSQPKDEVSSKERIFLGGNFGLVLGTYTQIEISPYIGYRFLPSLWAGTGIIFQYYGSSASNDHYSTAIYGSNTFVKFTLLRDFPAKGSSIFAYSGYELLNLSREYFKSSELRGRFFSHNVLIGGGLRQYLGGRASAEILFLFNVSDATSTLYQSPTLRVSFNF